MVPEDAGRYVEDAFDRDEVGRAAITQIRRTRWGAAICAATIAGLYPVPAVASESGRDQPESAPREAPPPDDLRTPVRLGWGPAADLSVAGGGAESTERISDWKDFSLTARFVGSRLLHPTSADLTSYGVLGVGAIYLERNKYDFSGEFEEWRSPETNETSLRLRSLGGALVPVAAVSTWLIGKMSGSTNTRQAGLMLTESVAFTFAATEVGQYVLAEERPFQGGRMHYFRPGGHGISGHTSVLAAVAVPLDRMFFRLRPSDGKWAKTFKVIGKGLVYAAPLAVGWSRMNDDLHFAWNVELGMGTGLAMGNLVSEAHGFGSWDRSARSWSFAPIASDSGAPGIALRWSR